MKCTILHEGKGRMRVHVENVRMTLHRADVLEAYLNHKDAIVHAAVYERTGDVVITYTGKRTAAIAILAGYKFDVAEYDALVTSADSRRLNREYQDKIVCKRQEQWMQWGLKAGMSFGVALSMMEYAFRGAGEIYIGNCVAVICLFLWLILYGREINFPSVLVETGRKYAFLIYLLHPAMSDLLKKCSEGLGVSNCQIYFWLRPVLVYMLTVVTVSGISAVSAYARQNILQNNHV